MECVNATPEEQLTNFQFVVTLDEEGSKQYEPYGEKVIVITPLRSGIGQRRDDSSLSTDTNSADSYRRYMGVGATNTACMSRSADHGDTTTDVIWSDFIISEDPPVCMSEESISKLNDVMYKNSCLKMPEITAASVDPPKRGRGRPKGSTKPKGPLARIRGCIRPQQNISSKTTLTSSTDELKNIESTSFQNINLDHSHTVGMVRTDSVGMQYTNPVQSHEFIEIPEDSVNMSQHQLESVSYRDISTPDVAEGLSPIKKSKTFHHPTAFAFYSCRKCDRIFYNPQLLKSHMHLKHRRKQQRRIVRTFLKPCPIPNSSCATANSCRVIWSCINRTKFQPK